MLRIEAREKTLAFFVEMIASVAIHIDTVQLTHAYPRSALPTAGELLDRGFEVGYKHRQSSGDICNATLRPVGGRGHWPRLSVTLSQSGYNGISAELSIAKLFTGHGLGQQTEDDIECALSDVGAFIRDRVGVEFDAQTAKVKRFDANADFDVGEGQIHAFVRSVSCRNSRMTSGTVGTTTAQYFNRSRTNIVYGKRAEMEEQAKSGKATASDVYEATGLLRIESRLRGAQVKRLAQKLDLPAEAGHLLTLPVAEKVVSAALTELGLDTPKTTAQTRDQKLIDAFGGDAPAMLGFLEWKARYGEEALRELWSTSKFYRIRAQLIETDFWLATAGEELPALSVEGVSNNPNLYSNLGISLTDLPDNYRATTETLFGGSPPHPPWPFSEGPFIREWS